MKPTIEVPKEWIEGLIAAKSRINGKRDFNDPNFLGNLNFLVGYIESAESFLKR